MWRHVAVLVLAVTGCSTDDCSHFEPAHQFNIELGCLPIQPPGAPCPTEYDCSALEDRDMDMCYLNGKEYEPGAIIRDIDGSACVGLTCRCDMGIIDCPWIVECPEYEEELPPGCEDQYEPGECCPTGVLCSEPPEGSPGSCRYGDSTFALGQYIVQYDKPCRECICEEDFDGSLDGPWCQQLHCFYELLDSDRIEYGCVPIVYQTPTCCSDEWRCPSEHDAVDVRSTQPSARQCTFGELTLQLGDFLKRDNPCVVCTCEKPPHVTCFKKDECRAPPGDETSH